MKRKGQRISDHSEKIQNAHIGDSESNFYDVGIYGENTSMILRQAAQGDRKLLESVSKWLCKTMGYSLEVQDVGNGLYSLVEIGRAHV